MPNAPLTPAIVLFASSATLLSLLVLLQTGWYSAPVPQGSDAMGLAIPMFASIGAAVCLIVATGLALVSGRLAWIDARSSVTTASALFVAVGIGACIVAAFFAWTEQRGAWVAPLGILGGGLAPFLVAAVLVMSHAPLAAQPPAAPAPKMAIALLAPLALAGFVWSAFLIGQVMQGRAQNAARVRASNAADEAKAQEARNRTPAESARDAMSGIAAGAPLWTVISGLPDVTDSTARAIIVERASRVPNLNDELALTLTGDYPRYRHGCLVFIQLAASRPAVWSSYVLQAIDLSAQEMSINATWFTADGAQNPHPLEHVRAMHDAAALFPNDPALPKALARLDAAVAARTRLN